MDGSKKVVKDPQTLILEGIDEQILLLSRDRRIIWANEKAIGDLGLKREDVIEKHCYEVTHHRNTPCGPPNEVCPIRESLETHAPATKTHTHFSPRGNKSYFEVTVYPVKDKSG
jgi:two-component system NtrC family sensor kinase